MNENEDVFEELVSDTKLSPGRKLRIHFRSGRWALCWGAWRVIPKREIMSAVAWCAKRNYELHGDRVDLEIVRLLKEEGYRD